jgi:phosphatidate phosphatase APP1
LDEKPPPTLSAATLAHKVGHRFESHFDRLWYRFKKRIGWLDPVIIQPYRGYADGSRLRARARVLEDAGQRKPRAGQSRIRNLIDMFHRFESDEIPAARVRASFDAQRVDLVSDEEGYLEIALKGLVRPPPETLAWEPLELELLGPYRKDQKRPFQVDLPVLRPPRNADFAVISDIDDTILVTGASSILRNLQTTLLNSVEQRSPFLGVASFYQALQRGQSGVLRNPVFYVSSSPWNLHDFLEGFIRLHDIPLGPMFLRDFGLDATKFIKSSHGQHKLAAIATLMEFYPKLRFILVGDSGQHDAGIYRQAVRRFPGRVLAVYIRALSEAPARDPEARAILDDIAAAGVQTALCPDLTHAAENAASQGWIPAAAVEAVRAEVAKERREEHQD